MDVIEIKGGFVVRHEDRNFNRSYMGRDGFWTREAKHALPFASGPDARTKIEVMRPRRIDGR